MKRLNKILIFSIFLILFISTSAISAANNDINITSDINQNNENLKANNVADDVYEYSNDLNIASYVEEDYLSDTGANSMSFEDLKNEISSSSTINLQTDVEYSSSDSIDDGILIAKAVTINGNYHTIDAKSKTRLFKIASGYSLTLTNVNIVNGYISGGHGGAILNSGTLKLTNCNFTNCKAVGSKCSGGALAGSGGGTIVKCNFNQCTATYMGGAASINKIVFKNCNFNSNSAGYGGALGGTAYIYSCYFKNCIATASSNYDGGGAGNGYFPRVESSTFINCKASKAYGGALRGTTNAYNCEFTNCVAKEGGAIRGKGITSGCTFKNCVAKTKMGGAIFTEKATIDKCTFISCSASKSNAGAVYLGNNAKITNCKFIKCTAPKACGGAVYGNGVVSKCTFEGNKAKFGGAVSSYSLTVKSSTFTSNSASKGGAAYNLKALTSCKLNKNTATYGGATFNAQKVVSSKFGNNYAKHGAVSYNNVNVVFKKVGIKNTIKIIQGLFYNQKHKLTLSNSKIINTGAFSKYLNFNTGTFICHKNVIQNSYKIKVFSGPLKARSK